MSDLRIIAISTAVTLVCYAFARNAERSGKAWRFRFALVLMLAVAGYLIYFGVALVQDAQPIPTGKHRRLENVEDGRLGLVLLIAKYWGYGVILLGVAFAMQACKQLLFSFWWPE
jgi:hypothetical protein